MNWDEFLRMATPEWIANALTSELEEMVRQISMIPKRGFPTFERLHERSALIDRELASRRVSADQSQIERRHREFLEHAQEELATSIRQHRETMIHSRRS